MNTVEGQFAKPAVPRLRGDKHGFPPARERLRDYGARTRMAGVGTAAGGGSRAAKPVSLPCR